MANTEFFTRIQLKYDTWENWEAKKDTLKLLKGEIAIVEVPVTKDLSQENNVNDESAILIKVGDDKTVFKDLPWLSAKAADVYTWAKQSSLPVLKESSSKDEDPGVEVVTNVNWVTPTEDEINALDDKFKGGYLKIITKKVADIDAIVALQNTLNGITGGTKAVPEAIHAGNADYAEEAGHAINADNATQDASGNVITTTYATKETVNGISNSLNTLIDKDAGKSARTIANEELSAQLLGEEKAEDNFKTLEQLATWLEQHPEDAAAMNLNISELAKALGNDYVSISESGAITKTSTVTEKVNGLGNRIDSIIEGLVYTGPDTSNTTATAFVTTVSQVDGKISASKANLPTASTEEKGIVKLNDTLTSGSNTEALTAKQGKALSDEITRVENRINGLDADNPTASGTSTTFIKTIAQVDGKITATAANLPTASTSDSGIVKLNNTLTSNSETEALTAKQGKTLDDKITGINNRIDGLRIDQIKNCETAEDPSQQTYVIFNCGTASFLI